MTQANPVYIGTIASQKADYRFKVGWIGDKKPEEWIQVENVHEPLVDMDTYNLVQEKVKMRKRPDAWGNYGIFAGLVKGGECGSTMNQRVANAKAKTRILTCAKYNRYGVAYCSQHRLELDTLYQIVLEQIRSCAALALADETKVMEELRKSNQCDSEEESRRMKAKLSESVRRLSELDALVSKLYEDWVAGRINETNFTRMMEKAQGEQETLQKKAVMQLQVMNEMMKGQFYTYPVSSIMILGIAGGNGLEHIQKDRFDKIYGIDINSFYLQTVVQRYSELNSLLECLCIDLLNETDKLPKVDMVIANLLIEYIGYDCFQKAIVQTSPKYVSCIIQINMEDSWVSDSPYLHVFDGLEQVHL